MERMTFKNFEDTWKKDGILQPIRSRGCIRLQT